MHESNAWVFFSKCKTIHIADILLVIAAAAAAEAYYKSHRFYFIPFFFYSPLSHHILPFSHSKLKCIAILLQICLNLRLFEIFLFTFSEYEIGH